MIDDTCKNCNGKGYTEEVVNMRGEVSVLQCYICMGTGQHVSQFDLDEEFDKYSGKYSR